MGEQILAVDVSSAIVFYFSPKVFMPDPERIQKIGRALIANGDITGMSCSRLGHGELTVYFNPMVQKAANYDVAERKMRAAIEASEVTMLED